MSIDGLDGEVIIYHDESGNPVIEVKFQGETAWLTQAQLAELFGTSRENITQHIRNIFDEHELIEEAVCKKFLRTAKDGKEYKTNYYNLDMILSLGYRIKSRTATSFRIWATARLREFIVKGFAMNDQLLKEAGGGGYWKELLSRIRDIRSSEKVLYRQVLDLYATSIDYNPRSEDAVLFFKVVQNKLHVAAHGHTAAELIHKRADAGKPFMGLLTFSGDSIKKKDILVAKNYLTDVELTRLNTLVSAYFDAAEFRAQSHEPTYMKDWLAHLDRLILALEANTSDGAGKISHETARKKAETEYKKYQARDDALTSVEQSYLESIKTISKSLEKKPRKDI